MDFDTRKYNDHLIVTMNVESVSIDLGMLDHDEALKLRETLADMVDTLDWFINATAKSV